MAFFGFQKSLLAVSATAAMAGMLFNGQANAQATTVAGDTGSIDLTATIIASTCVLNIGGLAVATATPGKKTLDLGTYTVGSASAAGPNGRMSNASAGNVVLSLKAADGISNCTLPGTTKWDIGVDLPSSAVTTTLLASNHSLLNTTTGATAATNIVARVLKATNAAASTPLLFAQKTAGYGHLLSGSTTNPNLNATDTITLTAELWKVSTPGAVVTAGAYTASIPLLVWYK